MLRHWKPSQLRTFKCARGCDGGRTNFCGGWYSLKLYVITSLRKICNFSRDKFSRIWNSNTAAT